MSTATLEATVEVLIAEDSATQAERLKHALEGNGYRVTAATNGRLALEAARARKPTLIITDIVMPEMDGYEFCRAIKSDQSLCDVPVILVTTLSDPHDVIRGLECRADNFIVKPYDEPYLLSRVKFVLLNNQAVARDRAGGVEIFFNGERHLITADRLQILNLLLSTYEAAIQRNQELARAKDNLRASNDALAAMNKELEAFSSSVSHDLRAPVNSIKGFAQLLIEDHGAKLEGEVMEVLRKIDLAGSRMEMLIAALLSLSKLSRVELNKRPTNLSALAEEIIAELQTSSPDRRVTFSIEKNLVADGDPALLRAAVQNLLANAWKYTAKSTNATIQMGRAGAATFFVRDNGVGFDAANATRLFAPFQRFHSAGDFPGTGVGLATVQRIIDRHGGRIWAESTRGNGATFSFTLGGAVR